LGSVYLFKRLLARVALSLSSALEAEAFGAVALAAVAFFFSFAFDFGVGLGVESGADFASSSFASSLVRLADFPF
jgi:hypothetical protein